MSEPGTDADLSGSREQTGMRKWQSKLLSKADKLRRVSNQNAKKQLKSKELDDDLSAFLHGSPAPSPPASKPHFNYALGGSATDLNGPVLKASSRPTTARSSQSFPLPLRSRKKRTGQHVSFASSNPEIIGEGGDEADIPAKDVISSWSESNSISRQEQASTAPREDVGFHTASSVQPTRTTQDAETQRSLPFRTSQPVVRKPLASLRERRAAMEADEGITQTEAQTRFPSTTATKDGQTNDLVLSMSNIDPTWSAILEAGKTTESSRWINETNTGVTGYTGFSSPKPSMNSSVHGDGSTITSLEVPQSSSRPNTAQRRSDFDELHLPLAHPTTPPIQASNDYSDPVSQFSMERRSRGTVHGNESMDAPQDITIDYPDTDVYYTQTQHLHNLFLLSQSQANSTKIGVGLWLRAGVWWFLAGRKALEVIARNRRAQEGSSLPSVDLSEQVVQAYVDLAKAWWLVKDVIPDRLAQARDLPEHEILDPVDCLDYSSVCQVYDFLGFHLYAHEQHMQKLNLMPPSNLAARGTDTRILTMSQALPPGILALTAGIDPRTYVRHIVPGQKPFFGVLIGDTARHCIYARMFAEAQPISLKHGPEGTAISCILSILRERTDLLVGVTIVSQDGQINLHIQLDQKWGPTWDKVRWDFESFRLHIDLMHGFELFVQISEADFKLLRNVYDHNYNISVDWSPHEHENIVFDSMVEAFHYQPHSNMHHTFPPKPIKYCRVRVMEKSMAVTEGTGERGISISHRVAVIAPLENKTLGSISHNFENDKPILFTYLRGENNLPALLLSPKQGDQRSSMIFTFSEKTKRKELHSLLADNFVRCHEQASEELNLCGFSIAECDNQSFNAGSLPLAAGLNWQNMKVVIGKQRTENTKSAVTEYLRVCMSCNYGSLTDPINLGPGELHLNLDTTIKTCLRLLRPRQTDITSCFAKNMLPKGAAKTISETLAVIAAKPTIADTSNVFDKEIDLHRFQALVTGFSVVFDGFVSSFSISRRHKGIPINKHLETLRARLQIVRQDKNIQLVAFFQDFPLGRSMNFVLRGVDTYEAFTHSGKHYIRFVDAKFAALKDDKHHDWEFVCLDLLEYAAEHDDVVVGFSSEEERDRFGSALPASVGKASRMASFMK
ncbi:hypothetical protein MMC26_000327 [Xylographa opegraphella]|nr:hypothetical protein [Xylographa opegraphella]